MKNLFHAAVLLSLAAVSPAAAFDRSHETYARVLDRYVRNGQVDCRALQADPRDLNAYLDETAAVPRAAFTGWPRDRQLAFLINLCNAATLKLIVDHYPVASIKDIGGI